MSYQIAILVVENKIFRDLIGLLSSTLAEAFPASGNTVRKWIIDYFEVKKIAFFNDLRYNCISRVYIYFDLWILFYQRVYIAVVIYYVDKVYKN